MLRWIDFRTDIYLISYKHSNGEWYVTVCNVEINHVLVKFYKFMVTEKILWMHYI